MIGAAEECTQFTGRRLGIGGDDAGNVAAADADHDRGAAAEVLERAAIDIGDQVAESIDAHHLAGDLPGRDHRLRQIEVWKSAMLLPSETRAMPFASHPAAGANRSRPSNVRLTVGRAYFAR